MSKKPPMTPEQQRYQLQTVIENSTRKMRDGSELVMAVGKLLEAHANGDTSDEVMSELVIGGLAKGLMLLSTDLWEGANTAQRRTQEAVQGGGL